MANETWLDNLNPLKITEDEKVKGSFINTYSKIHKVSMDEATMIYEKENMYFKKALTGSDKLQKCTKISLYSAFIEIAIQGISTQPGQKSEAYLESRGSNIGTKEAQNWINSCMLRITAYGELNMRISAGQIIRMKNPIVLYEGDYFQPLTNQRGELYVDYKPTIPRKSQKIYGAWVCIELPGNSLDFKWLLEDDIARLKSYSGKQSSANALYTADNGQIDPGFLEAKTIKHAMRAYTKLRVSDIASFEGEELEEKATTEPFGEAPAPEIKDTVRITCDPNSSF